MTFGRSGFVGQVRAPPKGFAVIDGGHFACHRRPYATVESEPGLGDRAWFGRSPNAAMIVTQKGARAVAVGIGGPGQDASKYRATLHKLIAGVAAKG